MSQDLIKRLEAATKGSRELDAEIFTSLIEPAWYTSSKDPGAVAKNKETFFMTGKLLYITTTSRYAPQFTSSIDAAVALAERVLPNHTGGFQPGIEGMTWATVYYASPVEVYEVEKSKAATPALALCIAILKAKEAISASPLAPEGGET